MALIATIPASTNQVLTLDHLPEALLVVIAGSGGAGTNFEGITNISASQSGRQLVTISSDERIKACANIGIISSPVGGNQGALFLAKGRKNGSVTLAINNGNTTPVEVYAVSSDFSEVGYNYVESSINPNANQSFANFDTLVIESPSQVARVNVTFRNGFNDDFSINELLTLSQFAQGTEPSGEVGNCLILRGSEIAQAVVYNGSLASTTIVSRTAVNLS
jgi:hypothetical protein